MIQRARAETAAALLERAVRNRVFPAAVAEVGASEGVLWQERFGTLTFDENAPPTRQDTVFDLASLTKPIVTTSVAMQLVAADRLDLSEPVAAFFDDWRGDDRERATVQELLEHSSGLAARLVDSPPRGRREFEHEICRMRLEYAPRSRSLYSDLGFILLGFIADDRARRPMAEQFDAIAQPLFTWSQPDRRHVREGTDSWLGFATGGVPADRIAPTLPEPADPRRGRALVGEVHDDYAAALGGAAGHAGLFGTARGVGRFARAVLAAARGDERVPAPFTPALVSRFARKSSVPGSSRALGWDTMLPSSSCGSELSRAAFGHVGFTGTSMWIDPALDRYFVLLTNRACGGGTIEEMRLVRRAFHDTLARA
jgi:CubicO group peptidase (beta-lactamase class C family)